MRPVRPGPCDDYVTGMPRCPQVEVRLVSVSSSPGCLCEAVFNCVCLTWHHYLFFPLLCFPCCSFPLFSCPSPSGVVCKSRICGTCEQFLAINCGVQDRELLLATQDVFSALFYSQSPSPCFSLSLSAARGVMQSGVDCGAFECKAACATSQTFILIGVQSVHPDRHRFACTRCCSRGHALEFLHSGQCGRSLSLNLINIMECFLLNNAWI